MGQAGAATRRNDIEDILHENALGAKQFIGKFVFPSISVDEQNGQFDKLAFSEIQTVPVDDLASDSSASNEIQHEYTTDEYKTKERRLKTFTADRSNKLLKGFDALVDDAMILQYQMMLRQEKRVADIAFDTASTFLSFTTAVTVPWSTSATAVPVKDVQEAQQALIDQINGMSDGARIIGIGNRQARIDLLASADIKNRWIQGNQKTSLADLTDQQIADVLGLDEVHFSRLAQSGSQLWNTDKFGIYMVSDAPQIKSAVRVGNTMVWSDNSASMWNVETWREEDPKGEWTRVQTDSIEKLLTARAGHVLTNVD